MSDYYSRDGYSRLRIDPEEPAGGDPMSADEESAADAMPRYSVGDELRMRREAMGKSIMDIVDAVRIQARYLEALEDGRLEDLPGTVYALGFVRTYAEFLGLDGSEVVARYKEETQGLKAQSYVMPEPLEEGKVPTAAILFFAVVLAAAAYGGWYFYSEQPGRWIGREVPDVSERLSPVTEVPPPALIPPAPEQATQEPQLPTVATSAPSAAAPTAVTPTQPVAAPSPAPPVATPTPPVAAPAVPVEVEEAPTVPPAPVAVPQPPSEIAAATSAEAVSPPAPEPPQEVAVAVPAEPSPSVAGQPVSGSPAPVEPPIAPQQAAPEDVAAVPPVPAVEDEPREARTYGLDNIGARIVITAEEDAWLEVTDSDDARLFSRVLRKGDSYRAPNRDGARFVTGNAGGLRITVDGQAVPALGPPGQVRRDVKLDPDLLKAGRAWP